MAIDLEMNENVLNIKCGAIIDTPINGTYTISEDENRIIFKSKGISYALTWESDGNEYFNFKTEILDTEVSKPVEDAVYFDCADNALILVGKAKVLNNYNIDTVYITESDNGDITVEAALGEHIVKLGANINYPVLSDFTSFVDGLPLKLSEDGSVTLKAIDDLLICDGGQLFLDDVPDKIHVISPTEIHFIYGQDTWAITYDLTDDGIKNMKEFKL